MKTLKIEFEGVDGSGKTTMMKYFIEQAQKRGLSTVETREVGNPHIQACVKMREFVLNPESNLSGETMEFIFAAMRFENDLWLRKLTATDSAPDLVISDRGWFSHLAYTDHNVSEEFTRILYDGPVKKYTLLPDVVIYFAVNTETALKRRQKRGTGMDVIEMKGVGFQEKVRESFEQYIHTATMNEDVKMVFRVDANEDIVGVQRQLDKILSFLVDSNLAK